MIRSGITATLLLLLSTSLGLAARGDFMHRERLPEFDLYHYVDAAAGSGLPVMVVEVRICNDNLQFEQTESRSFRARAEVTAELFAGPQQESRAHAWQAFDREVHGYNDTHADDWQTAAVFRLMADPGEYTLWIRMHDLVTDRVQLKTEQVQLPDLQAGPPFIGKPRLMQLVADTLGSPVWRVPNLPQSGESGARFRLQISGWAETAALMRLDLLLLQDEKELVRFDTTLTAGASGGFNWLLELPPDLTAGDYLGQITLRCKDERGAGAELETSNSCRFRITRSASNSGIHDLDTAVEQLRYIAGRKTIKKLRDSLLPRREELFNAFWKELDPTPKTTENELQYEYYRRVDMTNRLFGYGITLGWRTDRGRIYILLGPPDSIEEYPFESQNPPHEIWYYYAKELRFVFVDRYGFGDYRLVNQIW